MKKIVVIFILLASLTAVAFASFNNKSKKADTEKKMEKKKKDCGHKCVFS